MRIQHLPCFFALVLPFAASAAPIPGLYNSGVNDSGQLLANGVVDPHYTLVLSADVAAPGPSAFVVNDTLFPIVSGPWLASGPASKWIGPMANQSSGNLPGDYRYRLVFNLTGLEPSTAVITGRWTSDNAGPDILVNGRSTGFTSDGNFGGLNSSFTISSGFVDGTNTLDFVVNNAGTAANPTAVRIELSGTADLQPPPGTPPTITRQPVSQTVGLGESVVLTVSATGSRPLFYQWRFNGTPISGATNATYGIPTVVGANAGNYDVVVSNSAGAPTSEVAVVNVVFLGPAQRSYEPAGPSSRRTGLAFSEIMYHPTNRTDGRNAEFVELYNSNPFAEDLSGYRLTGAIDFTFAEGTRIPAQGYLVIAPVPADVAAIYGISGVLGGSTNNLPNDSGTIRLRKKSGGVVLEVKYSDQPSWPAAADGTGHSLVLARPSYGEADPKAWAASNLKGGSPGAADPVPAGPLENIVINEILTHTDPPLADFIELHNHSPFSVDLSGAWLSDDPATNKFRIPAGTILPAGGFVAFDEGQLGFALAADGETLYLVNPAETRVLDAVRYDGQANGVSFGRWPDGEAAFRELTVRTPGGTNATPLARPIVINEIFYNPISGNDDDQFVELYNRGAATVNLGGWRFIAGIDFTFTENTLLGPGGYLVVAANSARLMSNHPSLNASAIAGTFKGRLSHGGERLALASPDSSIVTNAQTGTVITNHFYVVMNEVTYGDGGQWGRWSDGGGSSLELVDAHSDNTLAASWADSDETQKSSWTTIEQTGVLDLGHPSISTIDQLHFFLLDAGEALVDDIEAISGGVNRVSNPGFENGSTGWIFRGTQRPSYVTNVGLSGARSLRLVATSRGDVVNRVQTTLTAPLAANSTVTLRAKARWLRGHPELLLRVVGNSLEAVGRLNVPANLGTPGAANSRARVNAGPVIFDVTHRPTLPQAGQSVRVTARIQDVDGVQTPTLVYRVDPGTTLNSVPMNDTGVDGDLLAGDGVFTGQIPGQSSGVTVAFRVQAADRATPSVAAQFPADAPARECLVRFGESIPAGGFGTYRLWMTQATFDFWSNREKSANDDVDTTFVYGGSRVVYNVGAHYGSSENYSTILSTPTGVLVGYNLNFPADDRFLGASGVRLDWPNRDTTQLREVTIYWLLDQLGLPNHYRRFIHLHINGVRRGTIYNDTQRPNSDSVEEWYPGDPDGELFKLNPWYEGNVDGSINAGNFVPPRLQNYTTTGGVTKTAYYRFAWLPRAVQGSANNYASLFSMIAAANVPGENYVSAISDEVDVVQWMRTFAMNDLASYWDAFGNPNSKNSYLYRPTQGGWKIMSWDFDVGLGTGNGGAQVQERPTAPLFDTTDPGLVRMNSTPAIVRHYWAALDEAVNGFFQPAGVESFLADRYAAFQAAGIDAVSPFVPSGIVPTGEPQRSIPEWITARRNFLLAQLAGVSNVFNVSGTNFIATTNNLITVSGTAPVRVKTITVNGIAYIPIWTTVNAWQIQIALLEGTNTLVVAGLERSGNTVGSRTLTAQFSGSYEAPESRVVINEIMYNPVVPEASYVELFNTSRTTAYDLSGWRLSGIDFTFPPGSILAKNGFMVVCKNRTAFASAYGWGIPVAGVFDGQLDDGGETLTLVRPGPTTDSFTTVNRVTYDDDPPWPAAADGQGSSLQLLDAAQDNSRASNWGDGSGWQFFSYTGNVGASSLTRFSLYFEATGGDLYLDDVSLVQGNTPGVGQNILANGGFEAGLAPWIRGPLATNSEVVSTVARSGNSSLHLIITNGPIALTTFYQDISGVTPSTNHTLSFWFLVGNKGTNLNARMNTLFRSIATTVAARFTPGAANGGLATLPAYPSLWISEVQPSNVATLADNTGEFEPWVEIYNGGLTPLNLDGVFLANDYANLRAWPFPAGTTINAGGYLLVWADNEAGESTPASPHANFRLNATSGSVILSRDLAGAAQVLDYVNYAGVPADRSIGSFPAGSNGPRNVFYYATPGVTNNPTPPPTPLFINEWMAANTSFLVDPADGDFDDWFEIYNPGITEIDLGGYRLTDEAANPNKYIVPAGMRIPAGGYLLVWADENTGQTRTNGDLHVNFKLSTTGEFIGLYDAEGRQVDAITFGLQTANVSQGRFPNGASPPFVTLSVPTPRGPNAAITTGPTITAVDLLPGNGLSLQWSALAGRNYRVQFKNSLDDANWTDLPGDISATSSIASRTDTLAGEKRFYRVLLLP